VIWCHELGPLIYRLLRSAVTFDCVASEIGLPAILCFWRPLLLLGKAYLPIITTDHTDNVSLLLGCCLPLLRSGPGRIDGQQLRMPFVDRMSTFSTLQSAPNQFTDSLPLPTSWPLTTSQHSKSPVITNVGFVKHRSVKGKKMKERMGMT